MAINIKKLEERYSTMTFEYGGQSMSVTYKPAVFWAKTFQDGLDAIPDEDKESQIVHWLTGVTAWELTGEDDNPLPITRETVEAVDELNFWYALILALKADADRRTEEKKA